jgi:hypothetical protein
MENLDVNVKLNMLIELAKEDDLAQTLTVEELDLVTDIAMKVEDKENLSAQDQTSICNVFERVKAS